MTQVEWWLDKSLEPFPQRASSLQVKGHPAWYKPNRLSVRQQIKLAQDTEVIDTAINVLSLNEPVEEEIEFVEEFFRVKLLTTDEQEYVHANAVQWLRAVTFHRVIAQLESDLQAEHSSVSTKRALLFHKLDILRPTYDSQLRVAERTFLQLRNIEKDTLWVDDLEERTEAQKKVYRHAVAIAKACATAQEIDELGDNEDEVTMEIKYWKLELRKYELLKQVQLHEGAMSLEST